MPDLPPSLDSQDTQTGRSGPETARFAELLGIVGSALDERAQAPSPDPVAVRGRWAALAEERLPQSGIGVDAVVSDLITQLVPHGARMTDPGFWMFITAGPTTVPVLAATAAHVAGVQRQTVHAFHAIEELSLRWLAELCHLPEGMRGVYSSGGSTANLVGLGAARQWAWEQRGVDPAHDGVDGRESVIYASTEAHHTVQRSAAVLGMGRRNVRVLPVDDRQRMRPADLESALDRDMAAGRIPVAVVASAGTTNTGAIDPLRALGDIAHSHDVWFHVDGAYGLPGALDGRVAASFDGLDLADSVIVDPHKWLNAPVGVAATFVRDRAVLQRAFTQGPADYLEGSFTDDVEVSVDGLGIPYADFGVELSAPSRGVQVWAILREEGVAGVTARIRRDNDFAGFVTDRAKEHPRLEALTEPELSIACVRYRPEGGESEEVVDELNSRIHRRLVRETPYLPSRTIVGGRVAIRTCFINPRTTWEMVQAFVGELVRLGDEETTRAGGEENP